LIPVPLPLGLAGGLLTSLALALVGTWAVRSWAIRRGFVDHPNDARRVHIKPTPNVGGIAIVASTLVAFVGWSFLVSPGAPRPEIIAMLVGGILVFGVGFWDDTKPLRPTTKFGLQVAIATLAYAGGVRIMGPDLGGFWLAQFGALAGFLITILWVVGTTNAFNLIDGSDGVAAGAALFASISMGLVLVLNGDPPGALMAAALIGSCLGFLYFNFPPATVFMGDCGALFLGYTLATLGVITTQTSSTLLALSVPVIAFGLPLLDTLVAIVRRYLRHQPIFSADRGHIHHRLQDLGFSQRRVAVLLYIACAGFASLSILLAAPNRPIVVPVFVVAGAMLILGIRRLHVPELTELTQVFRRGFEQRSVISHNVRLHLAAERIADVTTAHDLVDTLIDVFSDSEFSSVGLWVDRQHGAGLEGHQAVSSNPRGYLLRAVNERVLHPEQEYEIRMPLVFRDGRTGHLSLYRDSSGPRLFSDIRLVARRLVPELTRALDRLAAGAPSGESQIRGP